MLATSEQTHPQPGPLRGAATLTLHTIQAARLVKGRPRGSRPAIIGLIGFAGLLRPIWDAAAKHDFSAYWQLLQVESDIDQALLTLDDLDSKLETLSLEQSRLHAGAVESTEPRRFPLQFEIPYAYEGARLIADYDSTASRWLAAGRVGLCDPQQLRRALDQGGRALRRLFCRPIGFSPAVDPIAVSTSSGDPIPSAVLAGKVTPRHLPLDR